MVPVVNVENFWILGKVLYTTISMDQRFALWALDKKVWGLMPGKTNLETSFSKLFLI